jgi:hypothetical protein
MLTHGLAGRLGFVWIACVAREKLSRAVMLNAVFAMDGEGQLNQRQFVASAEERGVLRLVPSHMR